MQTYEEFMPGFEIISHDINNSWHVSDFVFNGDDHLSPDCNEIVLAEPKCQIRHNMPNLAP